MNFSERIEVVREVLLDLVEVFKRVKHMVLENGVELMLNAGYNCCHLEGVNALVVEVLGPVESFQIIDGELIEDEHHSCDDLALVHTLPCHFKVLLWKHIVRGVGLVPHSLSIESIHI